MSYVEVEYQRSERHACRLLGLGRSTHRYRAQKAERDSELRTRLKELAARRMRFGYRRLTAMLLREGMAKMGEHIFLNDYREADLWMELEPAPTWIGKAKQVLHKSQKLRLSIWRAPSEARLGKYGAPAPMLRTGFLASPLLLNTDQVRGFYLGQTSTRPAAYSLEADSGQEGYWRQQLRFRLYKIENLSKIRQQN